MCNGSRWFKRCFFNIQQLHPAIVFSSISEPLTGGRNTQDAVSLARPCGAIGKNARRTPKGSMLHLKGIAPWIYVPSHLKGERSHSTYIILYPLITYRIISHHIASYRIISHHIASYRIISYCLKGATHGAAVRKRS